MGGPVVLFRQGNRSETLVVSPLDNLKSVVHTLRKDSGDGGAWETGVNSEIESLPPGFMHRTLITFGSGGITAAMTQWGSIARGIKGTDRRMVLEDPVVNFLSFWTDNGAYYYGDAWQEAGGGGAVVNESAMLAVAKGLEADGLLSAVRTWQLDDWWYPGPPSVYVHCVQNWTLQPPAFTSTLGELSAAVKTPWLLYVPFFCGDENGGNVYEKHGFKFVQGVKDAAQFAEPHPDDSERFYDYLFEYGVANGMQGFENDFLNYNLLSVPLFRKVYDSSSKWLRGMNAAGLKHRVPIQMCMGLPSDLMASLELDAVTNYRASTDYALSGENIDVGGSALLALGLGLRPSKDNFWTRRPQSAIETGKPWGDRGNPGSNCVLNAMVATLSTGPFGIADKAGSTNTTIVAQACRRDGLIIQPDRPATYIDAMLDSTTSLGASLWSAKTGQHPANGHVWGTHASVNVSASGTMLVHFILSIDIKPPGWQLSASDLYPPTQPGARWVVHRWGSACANGSDATGSGCASAVPGGAKTLVRIVNDRGIAVANDTHAFDLHMISPVLANGWVLLGDLERYVSVSSRRFASVAASEGSLSIDVLGVAGETVRLTALRSAGAGKWSVAVRDAAFASGCRATRVVGQPAPACAQTVAFS